MQYNKFLDNEEHQREPGGVDPETGWRYEFWDIGMVRNAKQEDRKMMKVFLDPIPHIVLDQNVPLRGWYKGKVEKKGVRARPCYTEALLTQPYGGACPTRCLFCYVNNGVRGYRGQGVSVVDRQYPYKVKMQLSKMMWGAALYISSFTEPFQELEAHYHNTERLGNVAAQYGLPIFFLTRRLYPGWAIDLLKLNPYSYAQFSINTPDPDTFRRLSPRAANLFDILDQIKALRARGIYVSIQCNPVIPGIVNNDDVVRLIHMLAGAGANHMIFKFVEIVSPSVPFMVQKITKVFPERAAAFASLFTETIGGLRTIQEDYRRAALDIYLAETKKAGITMGLCYEYGYQRDGAGKIIDKTGVSLGPQYTTAAQCHGPRVPMFKRMSKTAFIAYNSCPPSGCLYCADQHGGLSPCMEKKLLEAPAHEPKSYLQDLFRTGVKL
jgi:DNA repair photolyase